MFEGLRGRIHSPQNHFHCDAAESLSPSWPFLRTTWGWANTACSAISPSAALPPLSLCVIQSRQKEALPKHGWKDCSKKKTSLSFSFRALAYDIARHLTVDDRCPNDKWLPCFENLECTSFCSASDFSVFVMCWKVKK